MRIPAFYCYGFRRRQFVSKPFPIVGTVLPNRQQGNGIWLRLIETQVDARSVGTQTGLDLTLPEITVFCFI